ncbi:hypothetical protein COV81_05940 [Candidatus Peregrinibacteria bacterium CG11_big_fil_rev_8_21_14_0_20_41_10]|nr:MAG: hypothetical protein COV81_05940 [Candidatus Peregrinibacteria bacterium CG11_big_fil_rev_8_21_14_0_20_41_10]PIZ74832.1 MAG: hypothetical protein COY06_03640 [Candidatus Peregrinibacteria bacterium CG_4_10_14_0_2_um_filter_41_8]PJC38194.1 MAG: hypothetical protein CO045_01565 [Candidatus Peregrinibacteria bacterium CG_4_9_14_0_2_um_filter_41_14]
MDLYFAQYQPDEFKSLLVNFHAYVGALLVKQSDSNLTLNRIKELKQNADRPDPISLAEERQLWQAYFPGAANQDAEAQIAFTKERLSKSNSFREFLFPEEGETLKLEAVRQFLDLIPREQYHITKVDEGSFALEPRLNNDQLAKLLLNPSLGATPITNATPLVQSSPKTPIYSQPQAPLFDFSGFGEGAGEGADNEISTSKQVNVTANGTAQTQLLNFEQVALPQNTVTTRELNTLNTQKKPILKPVVPQTAVSTQNIYQPPVPQRRQQSQAKSKTQAKGGAKSQGGSYKKAVIIAAITGGTGAVAGLPFFISLIT